MDEEPDGTSFKRKLKDIQPSDLLKALGGLAVLIPVFTLVFQYRQTSQQNADQNYRDLVTGLSSVNKEERLAAATNLGTFITKGFWGRGDRYNETIDILVNRISVELDYNVINAIHGSLMKVSDNDRDDYRNIIEKLLAFDRDFFVQEDGVAAWKDQSFRNYNEILMLYEGYSNDKVDTAILNDTREEMRRKWETFYRVEKDNDELLKHVQININFISMMLDLAHTEKLKLSRNSLNNIVIHNSIFDNAKIDHSAISNSVVWNVQFNNSEIFDTHFYISDLTNCRFADCKITASLLDSARLKNVDFTDSELNDVSFIGSDLSNADFTQCKGLKPVYFYKADSLGLTKAKFSPDFKKQLNASRFTDDDFKKYVQDSSALTSQRINDLFDYHFQTNSSSDNSGQNNFDTQGYNKESPSESTSYSAPDNQDNERQSAEVYKDNSINKQYEIKTPAVNLEGTWINRGSNSRWVITQTGNLIAFDVFKSKGKKKGQGSGSIQDGFVDVTYKDFTIDFVYKGDLSISSDQRILEGTLTSSAGLQLQFNLRKK